MPLQQKKTSFNINLTDESSSSHDFTTTFTFPIILNNSSEKDKTEWEIGLRMLSMWSSYTTISSTKANDTFKYSTDGGSTWETVTFPEGQYSLDTIQEYINYHLHQIDTTTRLATDLMFSPDYSRNLIKLTTGVLGSPLNLGVDGLIVDFTTSTFNEIVGFTSTIHTLNYDEGTYYKSEWGTSIGEVNADINSINLHCDIVSGSYVNSKVGDILYSFVPQAGASYHIREQPTQIGYTSMMNIDTIETIRVYITDQNDNALDLHGQPVSIQISFKPAE